MSRPLRVVVAGGGIGGLALASGLVRNGFSVAVLEADDSIDATAGYHVTLDRQAQDGLAELLAPELFEQLLASSAAGRHRDPDVFWDHHGNVLGSAKPVDDPSVDIDRIALRRILADGAGPALHLARRVTGYERGRTGTVTVALATGESVEGELLVGADGVHSVVSRQLAGTSTSSPTGLIGISGRTPSSALSDDERRRLGSRSGFAVGPAGTALYIGYFDPQESGVLDADDRGRPITREATYIWGAMFPEEIGTGHYGDHDGGALRDIALDVLRHRGWSDRAVSVMRAGGPDSIGLFRFHAASPDPAALAPWPAGNVTALGDAVHATPPTAGKGASVAIGDAARLTRELVAVRDAKKTLAVAIRDFEDDMRTRGSEAVRAAMKTVDLVLATSGPIGTAVTTITLPVLAALAQLSRRAR